MEIYKCYFVTQWFCVDLLCLLPYHRLPFHHFVNSMVNNNCIGDIVITDKG